MKLRNIVVVLALALSCFAQNEALNTNTDLSRGYVGHRGTAENLNSQTARVRTVRVHGLPHWLPFNGKWKTAQVPLEVNLHIQARHADGTLFADRWVHNLRTTGGADWQANSMSATSGRPAGAFFIALSNDATAPAAGDCAAGSVTCTLTSEIVANGLQRVSATYAHSNGTASYTLTNTFTATGNQSAQKAAVFNAASSGTMVFEALFTGVSLVNADTVTITWTVSI